MKKVIAILMAVIVVVLAYFTWDSIMQPIRFQTLKDWRYDLTKKSLINIRDAEVAYKSVHGRYTSNFDSLENFIKTGKLKFVKEIGTIPDSFFLKYRRKEAEREAIKLGIVSRDTVLIDCSDTLCKGKYNIDSLRFVPQTGGQLFNLDTATYVTSSKVKVGLFECSATNNVYLKGLERQEIINMNDEAEKNEKFPGLKVGSLVELNNNAGNWE